MKSEQFFRNLFINLTSRRRLKLLSKLLLYNLIKHIKRKKYWVIAILISLALWIKRERGKRIKSFYKFTKKNTFLVNSLQRKIKSYSPTFWIPFPLLKMGYLPDQIHTNYEFYSRWVVTLSDGEKVAIDIHPKSHTWLSPQTPTILLLPGFYSDSNRAYCVKFCEEVERELGWRVCVINRRGFGSMPFLKKKMVSYSLYQDIHDVIETAAVKFPNSRLYLTGISMGAMNIQRYLGEFEKKPKVHAVVAISSPWNSKSSMDRIEGSFFIRKVIYDEFLTKIKKHMHDEHFQEVMLEKGIDLGNFFLNR